MDVACVSFACPCGRLLAQRRCINGSSFEQLIKWLMLFLPSILVTSGVSHNRWQLLVGRVLNYIYIGMELASVPVYQSEVVPAPIRGLAVGSYQLSLGIGGLIINGICRGTSDIQSNNSWMIPYGLYYIIPSFIASCIWFIPEVSFRVSNGAEDGS